MLHGVLWELEPPGSSEVKRIFCVGMWQWTKQGSTTTPQTKRSSTKWIAAGESRPKRPKTQQWAGKVMAPVFWDYLEKGKTINSNYYMALLDRLSA